MLVENSYFPIILGRSVTLRTSSSSSKSKPLTIAHVPHRSFMEKRGVRTDPLDQTSVVFMDTGEIINTDLVVVKDAHGDVLPIS